MCPPLVATTSDNRLRNCPIARSIMSRPICSQQVCRTDFFLVLNISNATMTHPPLGWSQQRTRKMCSNADMQTPACQAATQPSPTLQTLHTHTHPFNGPFPGLPRWAGTRKVKPIWILLKQEKVSGSGISWAICKSAPRSRQITTPTPQHSVFYRPDALPAAQPTASKHWRHKHYNL